MRAGKIRTCVEQNTVDSEMDGYKELSAKQCIDLMHSYQRAHRDGRLQCKFTKGSSWQGHISANKNYYHKEVSCFCCSCVYINLSPVMARYLHDQDHGT